MESMERLLIINSSDYGVKALKDMLPKNHNYKVKSISWESWNTNQNKNTISTSFHFMWFCIKTILDTKFDMLLIDNDMSCYAISPNQRMDEGLHICLLLKMLSNYFDFVPPKIISTSDFSTKFVKALYKGDTDVNHFSKYDGSGLKKCLSGDCDCVII